MKFTALHMSDAASAASAAGGQSLRLPPLHLSLDHPPAVKRSTAVFDSGTEGCLRQPQATRGQVLRV